MTSKDRKIQKMTLSIDTQRVFRCAGTLRDDWYIALAKRAISGNSLKLAEAELYTDQMDRAWAASPSTILK